ncbi:MAG TPA: pirin family protein [Bacteroidales bacterium]|nr:pirin family protein [Bacteroidales bacterium]
MNTIVHKSNTRGHVDHGWLQTYHTFSFAGYYNPERVHFGTLRVLNDDVIAPGQGFGTHPHENMEIITIPLSGMVAHKDSMGNEGVIREGEVQVMSAGTGITHSEFNGSNDKEVKLVQIWIFPREKGLKPRYGQLSLDDLKVKDKLFEVISPSKNGSGLWLNSDSWLFMGDFENDQEMIYDLKKKGNGVYLFVISGSIYIGDHDLESKDGIGISDFDQIRIIIKGGTHLLLMEIPMSV